MKGETTHKKFFDMKQRLLFALVSVVMVAIFLWLSMFASLRAALLILLLPLSFFASAEFAHIFNIKREKLFLCIGSCFIVFIFFLAEKFTFLPKNLPLLGLFFLSFLAFLLQFNNIRGARKKITASMFCFFYVALPLGLFFPILYMPSGRGTLWILFLLVVTKMTDIGAYIGGRFLGKKKILPLISPQKTCIGAVFGVVFALISGVIIRSIFYKSFSIPLVEVLIVSFFFSIIGQLGDFFESLFKRDANLKDSSMWPGVGGGLDMIDSLIFNIILLYFLKV